MGATLVSLERAVAGHFVAVVTLNHAIVGDVLARRGHASFLRPAPR